MSERSDLRGRSDEILLDFAAEERRALVTRDVTTLRPLLRDRWAAGRPTWGAIFVSSSVPAVPGAYAYLADALGRIATAHPGESALEHEVWITAADSLSARILRRL